MKDFRSVAEYFQFAGARDFIYTTDERLCEYDKNWCEKAGDVLSKPVMHPLDFTVKNSRHPLTIAALTVLGLFLATLAFYPHLFVSIFTIPVVICLKASSFALIQATILGLGLRTLGRLNNPHLMERWRQQRLTPQSIGSLRLGGDM